MGNEEIISRVTDSLDTLRLRMRVIKEQHNALAQRKRALRSDDGARSPRAQALETEVGGVRLAAAYGGPRPL